MEFRVLLFQNKDESSNFCLIKKRLKMEKNPLKVKYNKYLKKNRINIQIES